MQLPTSNNNASYSLRQIYQKYLLPYERYAIEKLRREMDEAASGASSEPEQQDEPAAASSMEAGAEKRPRCSDDEEPLAKKQKKSKVGIVCLQV